MWCQVERGYHTRKYVKSWDVGGRRSSARAKSTPVTEGEFLRWKVFSKALAGEPIKPLCLLLLTNVFCDS